MLLEPLMFLQYLILQSKLVVVVMPWTTHKHVWLSDNWVREPGVMAAVMAD
jgi:hypothetical protein